MMHSAKKSVIIITVINITKMEAVVVVDGFWNYLYLGKNFFRKCYEPVCDKHGLSALELDIIIFLSESPNDDTATDIAEKRGFAKSNVSNAIRNLTDNGFLEGYYLNDNRRSVHLRLLDKASAVVFDAGISKHKFLGSIFDGFSPEELEMIKSYFTRLANNIEKVN